MSVIIVTWNSAGVLEECLQALVQQLQPADELIVSDNGSTDSTAAVVAELAPGAHLLRNGANLGFAAGANRGVAAASGDLVVLLNPDTVVADGWAVAIRRPLDDGYGWDAWQALVTMDGGRLVNTDGGVVHFTGIAWAGNAGRALAEEDLAPREVGFASGACLAVPRDAWERLGGMPEDFFMYCEDVDLSLRAWLAGGRVGIEPAAQVNHDYEFAGRDTRWRMLERNRWATILRTYPAALLVVLAPALVAAELAVFALAVQGGWWRQKLAAMGDVLRRLPSLARQRRQIQAKRTVSAGELARHLTPGLDSEYIGGGARHPLVGAGLAAYWRVACLLLGRS
jgi:GT2 family glycosyltransferase